MKRLAALTALIALIAIPMFVKADVPIVFAKGTLAATGDSAVLLLTGQSTCSTVLSGTWVGTVTPKGSSDRGVSFATASAVGAQTSNGTFSGDISAYTTQFKITFTRTSGTLAYAISCTGAVSTANVTVTAANVTVINTPGVTVQNTPAVTVANTPTVNQGTSPWVVTTPAPCATGAHGGCVVEGVASGTTIPITGTVTVNTPAPLPTNAAGFPVVGVVNNSDTGGVRVGTPSDGQGGLNSLFSQSFTMAFNGTTWDRSIVCPNVAVVNISSATTTSIVAVSGSTKVYVCSYSLYIVSGTLPSFQIEGGTGAACVTTQVPLTGTFGGIAGAVGELFNSPPTSAGTIFRTAASSALCLVSGGTTPNIQGYITWAQF